MAPKNQEVYVIGVETGAYGDADNTKDNIHEKEYNYEVALDIIGFGKIQIAALIVCGLILMAVICETMGMMIIVLASQCDLNLQPYQKGLLTAVTFFGILISSYFWGYLSDTYGRKVIIFYSSFATVFFSFISVLTNNFWIFLTIRLLLGISISGPSATIYAYLGEFNVTRNRQTIISMASIFVGIATTFIPGIAWLILPQTWSIPLYDGVAFRPWKLVLMIYSLPGLLGAILMCGLPESPKFLISQNREREAFDIVEWMYVKNTGKPAHTFLIRKLEPEGDKEYLENLKTKGGCMDVMKSVWRQTAPLVRKPHLRNLLICCLIQFGIFFSSAGMGLWFPEIQNRVNSFESGGLTVCDIIDYVESNTTLVDSSEKVCNDTINPRVFIDSMTLGASYVVGYAILAIIINPIGRRIVLPLLLLISGSSGVAVLFVSNSTSVVLFFCGYLMFSGLCVSVVNAAIVELIPTHLRGMAVCLQLSMGRLGSIVGSNVVGWLLYQNCIVTFSFYSGFVICCGLVSLLLPGRPK